MDILLAVIKLIACLLVLWKICDVMVEGLTCLAHRFKIPQSVAGATLAAISSSAPEFGTSLFSIVITEGGKFPEIGLGTILGSAIFNVFVIIGVCALFKKLKILPRVYSRDGVFYFVTVILLAFVLRDGKITLWEAVGGLVLYGIYGIILYLDIKRHPEEQEEVTMMPTWQALLFFIGSVAVIGGACHILVEATIKLSTLAHVPKTFLSVLILAAGTSIPDCFASISAARRGNASMAVSNALGSNVFDILICLGVPLTIIGAQGKVYTWNNMIGQANHLEKFIIVFSLVYLVATLALTLIILRQKWEVGKKKGFALISLYLLYLVLVGIAYVCRDCEFIRHFPSWFGY